MVQRIHRELDVTSELRTIARATRGLAVHALGTRGDEHLVHDALQEAVEAILLHAVVSRVSLPGPSEIGVEPEPYLGGLADLSGELRRLILRQLSKGDLEGAERFLGRMEQVHSILMRFETSRSILALKPKQDTSRALLERTRGDVTLARLLDRARLPRPTTPEDEA